MNREPGPSKVSMSREGSSVTLWTCHPPLNLLVQSVRDGLATCLELALRDPEIDRIVLRSAIGCFAAGADVAELRETMTQIPPLSDPEPAPTLRSLVMMIRESDKRTVAIIEGFALGGGFELALACDTRFAHTNARLGLPEVKLGLLPGSGGTQMLTRLAGPLTALDLCTSGRHLASSEALQLGLVDGVFEDEAALEQLTGQSNSKLGARHRSWRALKEPVKEEWFSAAALNASRSEPGFLAPHNVIKSIRSAANPVEQGLAEEWALWLELFWHAQREGRFHEFFASRDLGKTAPGERVADISVSFDDSARDRLGITEKSFGSGLQTILVTADSDAISQTDSGPCLRVVDPLSATPWTSETGRIVFRRVNTSRAIAEVIVRDGRDIPLALGASKCLRRSGFGAFASKTPDLSVLDALVSSFELAKAESKRNARTSVDAELARFGFVSLAQFREIEPVDPFASRWSNHPIVGPMIHRLDATARQLIQLGAVSSTEATDVVAVNALGFPAHAGGPSFALGRWKENVS